MGDILQKITSLRQFKDILQGKDEKQISRLVEHLSLDEVNEILYSWEVWARDNQLQPKGDWLIWLILAGRGWG